MPVAPVSLTEFSINPADWNSAQTITMTLIEGKHGNDDLLANSNIDAPGAPVLVRAASVIAQLIPILGPFGIILLASLIDLIARRQIKKT